MSTADTPQSTSEAERLANELLDAWFTPAGSGDSDVMNDTVANAAAYLRSVPSLLAAAREEGRASERKRWAVRYDELSERYLKSAERVFPYITESKADASARRAILLGMMDALRSARDELRSNSLLPFADEDVYPASVMKSERELSADWRLRASASAPAPAGPTVPGVRDETPSSASNSTTPAPPTAVVPAPKSPPFSWTAEQRARLVLGSTVEFVNQSNQRLRREVVSLSEREAFGPTGAPGMHWIVDMKSEPDSNGDLPIIRGLAIRLNRCDPASLRPPAAASRERPATEAKVLGERLARELFAPELDALAGAPAEAPKGGEPIARMRDTGRHKDGGRCDTPMTCGRAHIYVAFDADAPKPTAECGSPLRDDGECSVHPEAWLCRRVEQHKETGKLLPEEVTGAPARLPVGSEFHAECGHLWSEHRSPEDDDVDAKTGRVFGKVEEDGAGCYHEDGENICGCVEFRRSPLTAEQESRVRAIVRAELREGARRITDRMTEWTKAGVTDISGKHAAGEVADALAGEE